jgi:hypothetical protein
LLLGLRAWVLVQQRNERNPEAVAQYAAAAAVDHAYSADLFPLCLRFASLPGLFPDLALPNVCVPQSRFLAEPDPDDPVVKSHYRMIRSFTADDPRPLVPGQQQQQQQCVYGVLLFPCGQRLLRAMVWQQQGMMYKSRK